MAFLRFLGKLLISTGVGVLLFVLWILYGTGFYTHQQQDRLSDLFDRQQVLPAKKGNSGPPKGFSPDPGDPVFRIRIPKIDLNDGKGFMVVEGVGDEELALGPGHYPSCRPGFDPSLCTKFPAAWPGEKGRVIVSGHRTTHAQPFYDVNELGKGDKIFIETKWGDFTYVVYDLRIVSPTTQAIVVDKRGTRELVLTTCNPRFSAAERLIVFAEMLEVA
ncbi:MAG: sortase [Actinomycetota bacterium]|nr:sortase [Actinomycetota bacterium]